MDKKINLYKLSELAETLRKDVIGDPIWIKEKHVFEYSKQTIEVVVILKLFRAIQGVKSELILCNEGLFIDMCALFRCVNDCKEEICFLLEKYPEQSEYVEKFIKNFFEHTIDNPCATKTHSVLKKKIHSSNVRSLTGQDTNEFVRKKIEKVHKTFCGYIHANYAHLMQSYGGVHPNLSFNLLGIPSDQQKSMQMQIVQQSYISVLLSMMLICIKFKQDKYLEELDRLYNKIEIP